MFYCTDPEKWILDVENVALPATGLIIMGEQNIREERVFTWSIDHDTK